MFVFQFQYYLCNGYIKKQGTGGKFKKTETTYVKRERRHIGR